MRSTERRSYFGYGSNVLADLMRIRAPGASYVCSAYLDDTRWVIAPCGYATVIPEVGKRTYGVVWTITKDDEHNLDLVEGVGFGGYIKKQRRVTTRCGKQIDALVYETPSRRIGRLPQPGYIEAILDALSSDDFIPARYLTELQSWLR